jgi:small subunit ribosomal protein S6
LNAYETVIVVDPSLDESGVEKKLEKLAEVVKRNNGRMAAIDRWGRRKMSYPINNRHEGTYVCLQFFAEAGAPKDLTRVIQLDEHILRHLIVRGHIQTISAEPAAAEPAARPEPGPAGPAEMVWMCPLTIRCRRMCSSSCMTRVRSLGAPASAKN